MMNIHEILKNLDTLLQPSKSGGTINKEEIESLSISICNMKLSDEFYLKDLSDEELKNFNIATVIAKASKKF